MKAILKLSAICFGLAILMGCTSSRSIARGNVSSSVGPSISFDVFYESLSPYGRWINYSQYGQVWIPNAGRDFAPYATNGQWVYSDYGWTWVSNYSWGWAPFHYGRWLMDDYYGWIWVPGGEWAPAWVAWRNSPDYYGWAPLGPGVNINISVGLPAISWCFVPRHYFGSRGAYRYYLPRQRNTYIIHNTTIINNVHVYNNNRYYTGPSRGEVQNVTHRNIRPVRIASASRPEGTSLRGQRLNIYRPAVARTGSERQPATSTNRAGQPAATGNRPARTSEVGNGSSPNTRSSKATPSSANPARTRTAPAADQKATPVRSVPQNSGTPPKEQSKPVRTSRPASESHPATSAPRTSAPRTSAPRTSAPRQERSTPPKASPASRQRSSSAVHQPTRVQRSSAPVSHPASKSTSRQSADEGHHTSRATRR